MTNDWTKTAKKLQEELDGQDEDTKRRIKRLSKKQYPGSAVDDEES
jgi:hypothetical protein